MLRHDRSMLVTLSGGWRDWTNRALDVLFPGTCTGCGRVGLWLCHSCAQQVEPVPEPRCTHCGRPLREASRRCGLCREVSDSHRVWIRSATLHVWPMREAIHAFKYQSRPELAPVLARYLWAELAKDEWREIIAGVDAVVPVPLHAQRHAERGYNQSELLAEEVCKRGRLVVQGTWLTRERHTQQQVGLSVVQRQANVAGAFRASQAATGQVILLIDDVFTTGATMRACAAALTEVGARAVYGLTLATPRAD